MQRHAKTLCKVWNEDGAKSKIYPLFQQRELEEYCAGAGITLSTNPVPAGLGQIETFAPALFSILKGCPKIFIPVLDNIRAKATIVILLNNCLLSVLIFITYIFKGKISQYYETLT